MAHVPYVIEPGPNQSERVYDLYSRMLKDRIVFIKGEVSMELGDSVMAQLLYLESQDKDADIYMYINSPGGYLTAMFGIFDTMRYVKPDINTINYGHAASAASFLLAAGTPGKRFALPNSRIMIHEMSGGIRGKFKDMMVDIEESKKLMDKLIYYYHEFTGQPEVKIQEDLRMDKWFSPEEAAEYGLIDSVQMEKRD